MTQLVVKPVVQLAVSCKQTSNRLSNWLNVRIHDNSWSSNRVVQPD